MQSPSPSFQPTPGVGSSSDLKRSVSQATERISEIITAAEQVALDIRTDAETQARNYVAAQQREIDRVVDERSGALDRMTDTLVESAERFRRQAEAMLTNLDTVIDEARQALRLRPLGDQPLGRYPRARARRDPGRQAGVPPRARLHADAGARLGAGAGAGA